MQDDDKLPGPVQSAGAAVSATVGLCGLLTRHLLAFTTRPGTAGERWFNSLHAGAGLLLMPLALGFADSTLPPDQRNAAACFGFWALTVAANVYQRFRGALKRRTGYDVHSLFVGRAVLPDVFRDGNGQWKWRQDFALVVLLGLGWCVAFGCPAVLVYAVACGFLSVVPHVWTDLRDESRVRAARDARHDAEWLADEMRKRDRSRWN